MERDGVKKIMRFCGDIDAEMRLNKRILRDYEGRYYTLSGGNLLDGISRGKGRVSNPTESIVLHIPESASNDMQDLRLKITRLEELKSAVLHELNKLPLYQRSVIYDFYIRGLQWVQISERIHYSPTQCKKIRNRGCDNLGKLFDQNEVISNFNYPL